MIEIYQRDAGANWKVSEWLKLEPLSNNNKKYWIITQSIKLNIHESILINDWIDE